MFSLLLRPFKFLFYSTKNNEVTEIRNRAIEDIEKEYVIHPYLLDNLDNKHIHKYIENIKEVSIKDEDKVAKAVEVVEAVEAVEVVEAESKPLIIKQSNKVEVMVIENENENKNKNTNKTNKTGHIPKKTKSLNKRANKKNKKSQARKNKKERKRLKKLRKQQEIFKKREQKHKYNLRSKSKK